MLHGTNTSPQKIRDFVREYARALIDTQFDGFWPAV